MCLFVVGLLGTQVSRVKRRINREAVDLVNGGAYSGGPGNRVLNDGPHWRQLANTTDRSVRRRCGLVLQLL